MNGNVEKDILDDMKVLDGKGIFVLF